MVTNAEPEHEPTREERADEALRVIVAGHPQAAVRRIVLYVIVGVALLVGGTLGVLAGGIGLIALLLLAMTDQLA